MKKTAAMFILALIMLSLPAGSFYAGVEGGVGVNAIIRGENYKGYTYGSASGYSLSVPLIYEFNEWAGIESGITLGGKNYTLERYYRASIIEDLKMDNVFIEFPFLVRFKTPDYRGLALFASAGGYLGWWAWGKMKGEALGLAMTHTSRVDQKTDLSHRNRFEAGVESSLGCIIDFSHLRIQFGIRYALSLTDMNLKQEKGGYPIYNSTFTVNCGLMWRCF